MRPVKNVVVVGGGAAGWLAALAAQKVLPPNTSITVIESTKLGIVGVGESTNFAFVQVLDHCGIDPLDFIRHTEATFKIGCHFENFGNDGKSFFIPVSALPMADANNFLPNHLSYLRDSDLMHVHKVATNQSVNDFGIAKFALSNHVPFIRTKEGIRSIGGYQMHINAGLSAKYLAKTALERGINHIDAIVEEVVCSEDGQITGVRLDDGRLVEIDFAFDCTGFRRLIIGKHFQTLWVDYTKYLPVDSAMPFITQHSNNPVKPYTHFRARKFGWCWSIPTHSRVGNGYVFDSSLVSDEDVQKEFREAIDPNAEALKPLRFKAGRFENVWVKNCMALGLSSGFLEPMDGTSLGIAMSQLLNFIRNPQLIYTLDETEIAEFNGRVASLAEFALSNVFMHYVTGRDDTEFWRRFKVEDGPAKFQEWVAAWSRHTPRQREVDTGEAYTYAPSALICNYAGTNLTKEAFVRENALLRLDEVLEQTKAAVEHNVQEAMKHCLTQREFIDLILSHN